MNHYLEGDWKNKTLTSAELAFINYNNIVTTMLLTIYTTILLQKCHCVVEVIIHYKSFVLWKLTNIFEAKLKPSSFVFFMRPKAITNIIIIIVTAIIIIIITIIVTITIIIIISSSSSSSCGIIIIIVVVVVVITVVKISQSPRTLVNDLTGLMDNEEHVLLIHISSLENNWADKFYFFAFVSFVLFVMTCFVSIP